MKKKITLDKEQITYIDDYLKHHKIKYWDVRIELLDHIISDVEDKMNNEISFDDALVEVHKGFGNSMKMFWNSGVEYSIFANGEGYKNLIQSKSKETNKKYRLLLIKEIKYFFYSSFNLFLLTVFTLLCYAAFLKIDEKFLKLVIGCLAIIPGIAIYFYPLRALFQEKKGKSINLDYALFHAGFIMMLLNFFFQLFSPKGMFHLLNEVQFNWLLVLCTPFFAVFNYCGFLMFRKTYHYYNDLYIKLQKL